ncbi:MAG: FKBP-type peptidyl-prolyl cis-trans isomerase [Armatimonadota bacterium]|nr:FKBP-type peptidyl-prolyl cis-trans isomerase [bacterium]
MTKTLRAVIPVICIALALTGCGEKNAVQTEKASTVKPTPPAPSAEAPAKSPEKTKDGFVTTKSGLKYKDIKVGSGPEVKSGDVVTVNYKGWLDDGTVFDTSKKPGREPFSFPVGGGQVIKGWDEGLQGMKKGGTRELIIPPDLGYGSDDMGNIPPNSTLHFDVELLKIGG